MNLLILEDEIEAVDRLTRLLQSIDKNIQVLDVIESVEDANEWFKSHQSPDLICMDIHLADGLCFDIFDHHTPAAPIIFTTAYDQYAIKAFKLNSIDYLLKPIDESELKNAIEKYIGSNVRPQEPDIAALAKLLRPKNYRTRFLGRYGHKDRILSNDEIAYFQAENKLVFAFDRKENKFLLSDTIDHLENQCDPELYFRINRSELLHIDSIKFIENYFNGRLVVTLNTNDQKQLYVSRRRVKEFKDWASQ